MKMNSIVRISIIGLVLNFACAEKTNPEVIELPIRDLIPEGIAYNATNGDIFISSIHRRKIIRIDKDGNWSDFIETGEYGFGDGLGMKVNSQKNLLYAISVDTVSSCLFLFDISSGDLVNKYCLPAEVASFNDLIQVDAQLFLTSWQTHGLYKWSESEGLKLWLKDSTLAYPNGVAANDKTIFVASSLNGLFAVNSQTKELVSLSDSVDRTKGLDGLIYRNGSLFGIQNIFLDHASHALIQYKLNEDETSIMDIKTIDKNNPFFNVPTTLCQSSDEIIVLANSQLDNYIEHSILDSTILQPTYILKYDLR